MGNRFSPHVTAPANTAACLQGNNLHPSANTNAASMAQSTGDAPLGPYASPIPMPPRRTKLKTSDFKRIRTIGLGTFARVHLVCPAASAGILHNQRPEVYALKVLHKSDVVRLKQLEHVRQERAILASVAGHPFITYLFASFADQDSLYMLFDYVPGGELFSHLRHLRRFEEPVVRFYSAEILLVLEFLHEKLDGIAYRDLKPENILLDRHGHIKIVDFGFAKRLGYCEDGCPAKTYTLCGTPEYLAPEVILGRGHTTAVDWWTLGILIYELLVGHSPFWYPSTCEIYRRILERPIVFPQSAPISEEAQDIIRSLCMKDPSHRLGAINGGATRLKVHPFFHNTNWEDMLNRRSNGPIIPAVRYPGDSQCFDTYPEEEGFQEPYGQEKSALYDSYFADF